jgi:hypothetical protein
MKIKSNEQRIAEAFGAVPVSEDAPKGVPKDFAYKEGGYYYWENPKDKSWQAYDGSGKAVAHASDEEKCKAEVKKLG